MMENLIHKLIGDSNQVDQIEDNFVSYELYPDNLDASPEELDSLRTSLFTHLEPYLSGYIWQSDRFNLQIAVSSPPPWQHTKNKTNKNKKYHPTNGPSPEPTPLNTLLWGSISFGENIEDEWFTTWLLLELTRAFPVTARVWDNDGEYLLIEAAYALPRWLKPDVAHNNRIWLHNGHLHIIPLPQHTDDPTLPASPTVRQALGIVRGGGVDTYGAASVKIEAVLKHRLDKYPQWAKELMHRAIVRVPVSVAHVVKCQSQLVAAAVEAFYYRDPSDVRAARSMQSFPPSKTKNNDGAMMVTTSVVFNRCQYAQLALQQWNPPKGYPMPLPSDKEAFTAAELGCKLTAGFEAVVFRSGGGTANPSAAAVDGQQQTAAATKQQQPITEQSLRTDPGWVTYKSQLERNGFFPNDLPGSAAYTAALNTAIQTYTQTEAYMRNTLRLRQPLELIQDIFKTHPVDVAALKEAEKSLPPSDSDAWLHEGPEEMEEEIQRREAEFEANLAGKNKTTKSTTTSKQQQQGDKAVVEQEFDPTELASSIRRFIDTTNSHALPNNNNNEDTVDFNEAEFAKELQRALGVMSLHDNDDETDSDDEDEGSSFYSGSDSDIGDGDDEEKDEGGSSAYDTDIERQDSMQERHHRQREQALLEEKLLQRLQEQSAALRSSLSGKSSGGNGGFDGLKRSFPRRGRQEEEKWEAATATDSDDDDDDDDGSDSEDEEGFAAVYESVLEEQLKDTTLPQTFMNSATTTAGAMENTTTTATTTIDQQPSYGGGSALNPVDLDVNLVSSLLASYKEQGGMPGPAGNLAGLLGIKLPDPHALQD